MKKVKQYVLVFFFFLSSKHFISFVSKINVFSYTSYFNFLLIEFASLNNLEILDLSYNFLKGILPSSIRLMSSLKFLSLARNGLNSSLQDQGTYVMLSCFIKIREDKHCKKELS